MHLKNLKFHCELTSENPLESRSIFTASRRSYSAHASGLLPNDCQQTVIIGANAEEFAAGVLRDVDIPSRDKWAICKLLACWVSGEITDEACA